MTVSSTLHTATTRPLHPMQYPRFHEAAHTIASRRGIKDTSRQGRYHNRRFRMLAEEVGLEGERDPERGWPLMVLSEEAKAAYRDTVAQLEDVLAGRPGPQDRAATAASAG